MAEITIKLPDSFYKEEIRNNYLVSSDMKKVWAVELDLFNQLDQICKKHNITYYADSGTLLGAVRHHGFIPWDDDMDFIMYREDFEKLCNVADEFKYPYFLQIEETDPGSLRCHAQIRNSSTTGILQSEQQYKYPFNQGIFIDIFPLDSVPDDNKERINFVRRMKKLKTKARKYYNFNHEIKEKITGFHTLLWSIEYILEKKKYYNLYQTYGEKNPFYEEYINKVTKYNKLNTKYVMDIAVESENNILCKEDINIPVYVPFESFKMPVPKNYDKVLQAYYGDWHKLVKGQNSHGGCIFDTNKPYTDYMK
ncbi:hypothetical protein AYP97_04095 [Lactobacillus crispatus]|uniref:LicD family protein n=1 Tax=Lactobacillus TaxID=1578 RepID=UPI000B5DAF67|nr:MULTISPECIES: LicD family protein [Lactobacillus]OXC48999.1 hypothetical protein AYP96_04715 [Lactobacillus crispatus]OXC50306.1 hypothetical protein AYP97_04095 [Lactobacillus crispatus]OXC52222.1 hypothetical protein AYP98_03835 [Lactobacillus crispatus]OXC53185.1 hypothetical protein AYQ00_00895 [Lactobacillus crispatus]OXC54655.1 hypothetical protein AYP99_00075 [Lactobacillus crispatus]